jgi:hypothetical protein
VLHRGTDTTREANEDCLLCGICTCGNVIPAFFILAAGAGGVGAETSSLVTKLHPHIGVFSPPLQDVHECPTLADVAVPLFCPVHCRSGVCFWWVLLPGAVQAENDMVHPQGNIRHVGVLEVIVGHH